MSALWSPVRTFYFRNRDPLTTDTLHRIASASAGDTR
jgi:hypothetical protein